jgi:hypothetical protein
MASFATLVLPYTSREIALALAVLVFGSLPYVIYRCFKNAEEVE